MPLHQDLLNLARELVSRNPAAPIEADLRRGVSTAYYALFHLLVHEATTRLVVPVTIRPRVAGSFDHRVMRVVCQEYAKVKPNAAEFVALQQARYQADYEIAATITQAQADTDVMRAELAFLDWAAVQADPSAATLLAELLCRGIPKR